MESRPEMVLNWRSRGVATEAAMVSGLAPGRVARTCMVGKSTLGKIRHRQLEISHDAENEHTHGDQGGHYRTADKGSAEVHERSFLSG